jgi:hypothetical protein
VDGKMKEEATGGNALEVISNENIVNVFLQCKIGSLFRILAPNKSIIKIFGNFFVKGVRICYHI